MNKLNKIFQKNQVLTAAELNAISNKIDEIINALSSINTGGSGSGSGEGSQYDDSDIREALEDLQDAINRANATANEERERLDGVINDINDTVEERVNEMLTDKDFLDELKEGIQSESNFGDDDVDAYLQQIGIITRNNGQVTYAWSTIAQDVNSLRASVNNLIQSGVDQEALQAAINAKIEDSVASLDLSTMYARKNAETVIEWMYSALKQSTSADKSYNEIVSAGKDGLSSAIAELRTYVERLKNGKYVATSSLAASVDSAISELKNSASSNAAKTEIFNKISKNSDDIASIVSSITENSSSTTIANKIAQWKAELITEANVDQKIAQAGFMAANDFTSAAVIAKVNEAGSNVKINADKINIDANHQLDLSAQTINVKASDINLEGKTWAQVVNIDTASIKNAVVEDLTAGDLTITGTLHYNKLIGNTTKVSASTQLSDDAYFVEVTHTDYTNYITISLPTNPVTGQTVFIGGSTAYKLAANQSISIYYKDIVAEENYKQYLRQATINPGQSQKAFDAGWQGYVEFIYTGTYWQQLIHNINIQ